MSEFGEVLNGREEVGQVQLKTVQMAPAPCYMYKAVPALVAIAAGNSCTPIE